MFRNGWHLAATVFIAVAVLAATVFIAVAVLAATVFIAVAVLAATPGISGATPKTVAQKCDALSDNTHLVYDDTTFHFDVDSAPAAVDVRTEVTITAHRGRAEGTTATAMAR